MLDCGNTAFRCPSPASVCSSCFDSPARRSEIGRFPPRALRHHGALPYGHAERREATADSTGRYNLRLLRTDNPLLTLSTRREPSGKKLTEVRASPGRLSEGRLFAECYFQQEPFEVSCAEYRSKCRLPLDGIDEPALFVDLASRHLKQHG